MIPILISSIQYNDTNANTLVKYIQNGDERARNFIENNVKQNYIIFLKIYIMYWNFQGKGFENVLGGGWIRYIKCVCMVVCNKSKCGSRGGRGRDDLATFNKFWLKYRIFRSLKFPNYCKICRYTLYQISHVYRDIYHIA